MVLQLVLQASLMQLVTSSELTSLQVVLRLWVVLSTLAKCNNGLTGITVSAAANGGLYAWSDGTDTYFGFNSASADAGQVVSFRVTGADLINTTGIDQNVAANTSNVSFSLGGSTTTGLSISLI